MRYYPMRLLALLLALFPLPSIAAPSASFSARTTGYSSSESQGTAPLGVVFNATATTDAGTSEPFHDLLYIWDFGDPGAGTWTYGVGNFSKNRAFGPIAGHLYTSPGTYTVKLDVVNGAGQRDSATTTITVTDPASDFSLANTFCYANTSGTFFGCPLDSTADGETAPQAGDGTCQGTNSANCVVTSNAGDVTTNIASNTRHLLARDDTFGTAKIGISSNAHSGQIAAFGTGAKPNLSVAGVPAIDVGPASNWTIFGLRFDPNSTDGRKSYFADSNGTDDITLYDLTMTGGSEFFSIANAVHTDQFVQELIYDNDAGLTDSGWVIYELCKDCAMLGIKADTGQQWNNGVEGPCRFMHFQNAVASNNFCRGGESNKTVSTIRSCAQPADCAAGTPSQYWVFSDNLIAMVGAIGGVAISLQEEFYTSSTILDGIIERNYAYCDDTSCNNPARLAGRSGQNGDGTRITIRNNILNADKAEAANDVALVIVGSNASDLADDWRVYNNTIYAGQSSATSITFANMGTGSHVIRSNLMYAPNKGAHNETDCAGTCTASNNLMDGTDYTGDPFVTATGPRDTVGEFVISGSVTTGTSPQDNGYDFSAGAPHVFLDMLLGCRPAGSGWDVGAHELSSETACWFFNANYGVGLSGASFQ